MRDTLAMVKKHYLRGIASYLLIPFVVLLGAAISGFIDPEIAARYPNYERNYRLLSIVKGLSVVAAFLAGIVLWFLTNAFLLRSKERSSYWLPLAVLGPPGFIVLTLIRDNAPVPGDQYQRFIGKQSLALRAVYELVFFPAALFLSYQAVAFKNLLTVLYESARTGLSVNAIIDQRNASSGMWAFSEGVETLYLLVAVYLLWPVCFNMLARMARGRVFRAGS